MPTTATTCAPNTTSPSPPPRWPPDGRTSRPKKTVTTSGTAPPGTTASARTIRPCTASPSPPDDPFWKQYFPPNGWRCRCTVVQVNKGKYPLSDSKEAVRKGEKATTRLDRFGNNKDAIFRFNPGIDERLFPPKHPYLPKGCGDCRKGVRNLAYDPDNPMCQACLVIATCADKELVRTTSKEWIADAIRKASDGKPCKRAITVAPVPEKMLDFCEKNKIDLAPGGLQVTDDGIMHALRPNKKARGAAISTEQMENMAEILEKADIYYDSADDKRNFVFVAEDKGKIIKFVFNPNYTARADGKKEKRNLFVTAGIIQVYNINWTKIE